jgi:hypothetical protein
MHNLDKSALARAVAPKTPVSRAGAGTRGAQSNSRVFVNKNSFRSAESCRVLIAVEHFYTEAMEKSVRITRQNVLMKQKSLFCRSGTLFVAYIRVATKQSTQDGLSRSLQVSDGYSFSLKQ